MAREKVGGSMGTLSGKVKTRAFPAPAAGPVRGLRALCVLAPLACALAFLFAGCASSTTVVRQRQPGWMVKARQQLRSAPESSVSRGGTGVGASVSADEGNRDRGRRRGVAASGNSGGGREAERRSASAPPEVSWGETEITVEVEE